MRLRIFAFCAALLLGGGLSGCESRPATTEATAPPTTASPADTTATPTAAAAYTCPMACEGSASDKPGKCSVCGMALEPAAGQPAS